MPKLETLNPKPTLNLFSSIWFWSGLCGFGLTHDPGASNKLVVVARDMSILIGYITT